MRYATVTDRFSQDQVAMPMLFRALIALTLCTAPVAADAPLAVEIVTTATVADTRSQTLTGEIVARDQLNASFPQGGRISQVLVEEGDVVDKGAPLVRMEAVQQQQALRAAEAGLSTAKADHAQAIEDLDRQTALLERGATTRIRRDSAQDALRIAEATLAQALSDLERAEKALSETVLLAPMAATVIKRAVEPGQVVGSAQPVLELALGEGIDAIFDVPEVLMTQGYPIETVSLELIDSTGPTFEGRTREISPLVDPTKGTVAITVSIIDPPSSVNYGDAVLGTATTEGPPHITLPHTAMSATADGPAVWVVDPDTMAVSVRQITIDRFETGRIIVADGLEDGTLVVARGAQLLYSGRIVRQAEITQ